MLLLSGCHQQPQQHLVQTMVLPPPQAASAPIPSPFLVNIQGLMSSGYSCIAPGVSNFCDTVAYPAAGCCGLGLGLLLLPWLQDTVRRSDIHSNSTSFITYHCLLHSCFSLLYIYLSLVARNFIPVVIYIVHFIYISIIVLVRIFIDHFYYYFNKSKYKS